MKYEETSIIINNIKQKTQLNDEALNLLGVTPEKIDKAMTKCVDSGMSRKKAAEVVYKMWENAGK